MKTAILLLVLLCASTIRADTIGVSETTFLEPVLVADGGQVVPLAPDQSVVKWIIDGNYDPAVGINGLNPFNSELPLIYELLGINLDNTGPVFLELAHVFGQFVGEQLEYVTDLPAGISFNGTLDIPSPTAAPEPGTLLLLGSGLVGLGLLLKRSSRSQLQPSTNRGQQEKATLRATLG